MTNQRDDILEQLSMMAIPSPRENFARDIIAQAKDTKQRRFGIFSPLRQFRAALFVPAIRRTVALSVIGGVMLIGLFADLDTPLSPEAQLAQLSPADMYVEEEMISEQMVAALMLETSADRSSGQPLTTDILDTVIFEDEGWIDQL